jgi:hypothetical protein
MARALPSVVPPKLYRHFALVTVLLTGSVAMFADGENREAAAAQVEQREDPAAPSQQTLAAPARPKPRNAAERHQGFVQSGGFDGFDASFGRPMDKAVGSLATYTNRLGPEGAQTGYSETYLASLDPVERKLLLDELEQDGMLAPGERERKAAALVAASEARSGTSRANY